MASYFNKWLGLIVIFHTIPDNYWLQLFKCEDLLLHGLLWYIKYLWVFEMWITNNKLPWCTVGVICKYLESDNMKSSTIKDFRSYISLTFQSFILWLVELRHYPAKNNDLLSGWKKFQHAIAIWPVDKKLFCILSLNVLDHCARLCESMSRTASC